MNFLKADFYLPCKSCNLKVYLCIHYQSSISLVIKWIGILSIRVCVVLIAQSCLFVTPWTVARQASLSSILQARTLEWLPCPSPGDCPDPEIEPGSSALQVDSLPLSHWGSPVRVKEWTQNTKRYRKTWKFSYLLTLVLWSKFNCLKRFLPASKFSSLSYFEADFFRPVHFKLYLWSFWTRLLYSQFLSIKTVLFYLLMCLGLFIFNCRIVLMLLNVVKSSTLDRKQK